MKLVSVYDRWEETQGLQNSVLTFLWELLLSRPPEANISHKRMPTWEEHFDFVINVPYQGWFLIEINDRWIGAIYLTRNREIGLHLLPGYRGRGYGKVAVEELIKLVGPGRFLANIAPQNYRSQEFFERNGFRQIQATYELVVPE